ncbi:Protein-L-isoaspartate O-methyltransferase domain-containing protein 1 [Homalodisca vitripennis]|nr:Protein-L-isoaspartate O-methyltransferase domain-containing protein 1 [Homalodisca vitripennis]
MPHNDQLLQITRVTQTQWEHKSVLPVSFSTLQIPTSLDTKSNLALPDTEPISLQAVCRSCIRRTLRSNAEREFPELTKPRARRTYHRKKRAIRNLVIPFLESSDDEDSALHSPGLLIGGQGRITAVFNVGRSWPGTHSKQSAIWLYPFWSSVMTRILPSTVLAYSLLDRVASPQSSTWAGAGQSAILVYPFSSGVMTRILPCTVLACSLVDRDASPQSSMWAGAGQCDDKDSALHSPGLLIAGQGRITAVFNMGRSWTGTHSIQSAILVYPFSSGVMTRILPCTVLACSLVDRDASPQSSMWAGAGQCDDKDSALHSPGLLIGGQGCITAVFNVGRSWPGTHSIQSAIWLYPLWSSVITKIRPSTVPAYSLVDRDASPQSSTWAGAGQGGRLCWLITTYIRGLDRRMEPDISCADKVSGEWSGTRSRERMGVTKNYGRSTPYCARVKCLALQSVFIASTLHTHNRRRRIVVRGNIPSVRAESHDDNPSAVSGHNQEEIRDAEEIVKASDNGEASTIKKRNVNVPKREKFDSGVVEDLDNGKGLTSSDEETETNANCLMSSDDKNMEVDTDSDFVEASDDEGVEEDLSPLPKKGSGVSSKREKEEPEYTYSSVMQAKIKSLPLPPVLKSYLNLYRDF